MKKDKKCGNCAFFFICIEGSNKLKKKKKEVTLDDVNECKDLPACGRFVESEEDEDK